MPQRRSGPGPAIQVLIVKKGIFIVLAIIIASLIVDTSLGKIGSTMNREWRLSNWPIGVFIVIAVAYGLGSTFILQYVKETSRAIRSKVFRIDIIHKTTTLAQYTLIVILTLIILQIVLTAYYYTSFLITASAISYLLTASIMGTLAYQLFRWYKTKANLVILLYGLSCAILAVHAVFTLGFIDVNLLNLPAQRSLGASPSFTFSEFSTVIATIGFTYFVSAILSFVLIWGATVMLLRPYSQRLGKFRYWIMVSLPLAFFVSQFIVSSLKLFLPLLSLSPSFFSIFFSLLFALSLPVGGILFGIAFWTLAKSLCPGSAIRDYMSISAYGFVLFFVSDQTTISIGLYPPFGAATTSVLALSSYMIFIGIYSSSISLSQDSKLRGSIRKSAIAQLKLLESIGTAQMEQELRKRVLLIAKKQSDSMVEETGVQLALSEDDIKQYLDEVIKEIATKNKA